MNRFQPLQPPCGSSRFLHFIQSHSGHRLRYSVHFAPLPSEPKRPGNVASGAGAGPHTGFATREPPR
ncbi:hypothetical protein SAMN04487768_2180 [Burkholderia sp. b13]|nr:hypothetical protein SAMN04487768_2012 [Burkholderia sp. b13]SIT71258.1 hypothetical protein SAMN04487768_2180 [Burkholderia sp. b13]